MSGFAKKMSHLLLWLVIVSPSASYAKVLKKGMLFLSARHLLINAKWQPINVHKGEYYQYIGIENELIEAHIQEVENCAIDKALCIFNYKKADKCLRLISQGEQIKDMRVYNWTDECPD